MESKKIMEATLTYENCAASFFTASSYSNAPYDILGVQYTKEEDLKKVVKARCWFTYRNGFDKISGSEITSDAGWGCAVRVGQMLLCETLRRLSCNFRDQYPTDNKILEKFHDRLECPYSLQNLVLAFAGSEPEKIGTWLGPNNVCHAIKKVVENNCGQTNGIESTESLSVNLQVHVAMDCTIVLPEIPDITPTSPLLLLIPLRLGLDAINLEVYEKPLIDTLSYPQSVGIIGGRPRTAYYFFGKSCANELLALDPHTVKDFCNIQTIEDYSCDQPLIIPSVGRLDPSMALGFLCRNQLEFTDLVDKLHKSNLCAVMKELPLYGSDLDCDLPDTDDEFEVLQ